MGTTPQLLRNLGRRRGIIISVWLISLFINLGFIFQVDLSEFRIAGTPPAGFREPINKLYTDFLALYATFLTTMLGIGFANGKDRLQAPNDSGWHFRVAVGISIAWNIVIVVQIVQTTWFHSLDIEGLTEWVQMFVKSSSFLVGPFLAHYFSSERA